MILEGFVCARVCVFSRQTERERKGEQKRERPLSFAKAFWGAGCHYVARSMCTLNGKHAWKTKGKRKFSI